MEFDATIWQDADLEIINYTMFILVSQCTKQSSAKSSNRYFLYGDGNNDKIFAVAKYAEENADFDGNDVVICFILTMEYSK